MRAAVYETFQGPIEIRDVPDPSPSPTGVVLKVGACGICRSDWHGWMGNDPDIRLPHVPGHELAGEIVALGSQISSFKLGDRVTVPFVAGCGDCEQCNKGDQQICDHQFQPGFTAWGGFAEYVALEYAADNLVKLPDEIDYVTAASLGCRFATSFRAVVDQGRVEPGQWVAVWGCGGVGFSAIMIAAAFDARVIAVDIDDAKLEFARTCGATATINSRGIDPAVPILDLTGGGAHLAVDALGHPEILLNSVRSLRKRGRHIQVGIMEAGQHNSPVPVDKIIARELEIFGSHGMQAHRYPEMLAMISEGRLKPKNLVSESVTLKKSLTYLMNADTSNTISMAIIDAF